MSEDGLATSPFASPAPSGPMTERAMSCFVSMLSECDSLLARCAPRPSNATFLNEPLRRRVLGCCCCSAAAMDSGGLPTCDSVAVPLPLTSASSGVRISSVLDRDRGRWCSPEERINENLDRSPLAPEPLRFLVTFELELEGDVVGRDIAALSALASAPSRCGFCSIVWSLCQDRLGTLVPNFRWTPSLE